MAKSKWNKELIIKNIIRLEKQGEDLTSSNIKQIDSPLVGAAVSYFGNWGNAVREAGLDYDKVRKKAKAVRKEKVKKWSTENIIGEIRSVAETEDDLSYAYMKEKYSSLVAAACNYFGSWKTALEKSGVNYSEVLKKGRKNRSNLKKEWRQNLLLERLDALGTIDENIISEKEPRFYKMLIQHFSSWRTVVTELRKMQSES